MRKFTISLSALLALSAPPAFAEQQIGSAALIEKEVDGLAGERSVRLKPGDGVFFEELLKTGLESRGKFVFDDRANLQMGPSSQVKLDSFVYANAPAVAFNAAKGVFRFVSAPGGHKGYEVRTPKASIGVRGTAFGVRATPERTDAVLYEGSIEVCLTAAGGVCRVLDKPCTFVTVTESGFTTTSAVGADDWSFDDSCKPKPAPAPRRRHGGLEPPHSAPPPVIAPRRAAAEPPPRMRSPAPPRARVAQEPPPPASFRPRPAPVRYAPRPEAHERPQYRPRRPYYPPVSRPEPDDDPEPEPYYRPRPRPFPFFPPIFRGDSPYRPHYPRPDGPYYPRGGMRGEGRDSPPAMRGPGSYPFPSRGGWGYRGY